MSKDEDEKVVDLGQRREEKIIQEGEKAYARGEAYQFQLLDGYVLNSIGLSSEGEVVIMHDPENPLIGLAMEPDLAREVGLALIEAAEQSRITFSEEASEIRRHIAEAAMARIKNRLPEEE